MGRIRSDWDIATNYIHDVGAHRRYITWWGRIYLRDIFPADFPRGNPRPWRHASVEDDSDTSEDLGEANINDQQDDAGEQEASGDGDDSNAGKGDQDGYDEGDGEEEDDDDVDEDDEEGEEGEEVEENESDVVPHHSGDDTISLDPPGIPSRGEKDPLRGIDSIPHRPLPTV